VRAIPGDITKPASLRPGMRDADIVIHLAALTTVGVRPRDQARMRRINVDGTRQVLELAAQAGVRRIVHVSTVDVYGDTQGQCVDETHGAGTACESEYQRTRQAAHFDVAIRLQQQGAPIVVACLGAAYGPGDLIGLGRLLRRQLRRRLPVMLGPDSARCWTFVDDAVAGLRLAAERGRSGETYNLAGPPHTLREVLEAAARVSRAPAPLLWLPASLALFLARALSRPLPAAAERLRALGGATYLALSTKAERELGWAARPLAEGLPATIAWLQENAL
jgi:dihydroflavonol-4-reductase